MLLYELNYKKLFRLYKPTKKVFRYCCNLPDLTLRHYARTVLLITNEL